LKNEGIIPKTYEPILKLTETFDIVKINIELMQIRKLIEPVIGGIVKSFCWIIFFVYNFGLF